MSRAPGGAGAPPRRREIEDPNNTWDMQLMAAILRKDTVEAQNLLNKGAHIDHVAADAQGRHVTPLIAAALKGDVESMAWLCSKGANPNAQLDNNRGTVLHYFVRQDSMDLLEKICSNRAALSDKFNIDEVDGMGVTPVQLAINSHKPDAVRCLLRHGSCHMFHCRVDALHCQTARACCTNDIALLETLLQSGDSPFQKDSNGQTLMHLAIHHPAVMDMLIDRGLSINVLNSRGQTPLLYVVQTMPKSLELVDSLLQRGADVNQGDALKLTPLMHSIIAYNTDMIRKLIEAKSDINARDAFGGSALHWAVVARHRGALELLLNMEGNPNAVDNRGQTPLHRACEQGKTEAVQILLSKDSVDVNIADRFGSTALHTGVAANQLECVRLLLRRAVEEAAPATGAAPAGPGATAAAKKAQQARKGAAAAAETQQVTRLNVEAEDGQHHTALQLAVQLGLTDIARALVGANANVHRTTENKGNLLHVAVKQGNLDMVRLLVGAKAVVSAKNADDVAPLHLAVDCGLHDIALTLIEGSACVDDRDAFTLKAPLHRACERADSKMVKLLVEAGKASLNLTDRSLSTPLHVACDKTDVSSTAFLLENGASFTMQDARGWTALHAACASDSVECAKLLLLHGASATCKTMTGWTPLHAAVACGAEQCTIALLELLMKQPGSGGSASLADELLGGHDSNGRSLQMLASENGRTRVGQILVRAKLRRPLAIPEVPRPHDDSPPAQCIENVAATVAA